MKIIMLLVAFFTVLSSAQARLGETPAQCQQRYGAPVKVDREGNTMCFMKGGFFIIVEFFNGRAETIMFRKVEQNVLGMGEKLTDNEIESLLAANGNGKKWKTLEIMSMDDNWITEDGDFIACYKKMDRMLLILTKEKVAREMEEKKQKENKNLRGF
jgi:hypothetical protein